MAERRSDRWAAHPRWAAAVRIAVVLVPIGLSILTAVVVGRLLPVGDTTTARIGWWLVVFLVSSVVLVVSDRLARRLLPLAVLLELSLVFPDRAPKRMRSVRTASVRDLEDRLARLRARGATTQPLEAAETLVTLIGVLGLHDKRTRGHSERVRALVDLITDEMGLPDEDRARVRWAALVHDLGKLSVPAAVLNKPGSLDPTEWDIVRQHPHEGAKLAAGLLPWLGDWGRAIEEHHERWDGLGYPRGLAGEEISLGARIVAVADSYEVMTTARSYGSVRSASLARKELTDCAGAQFDPHVVRVFLSISLGRLRWVFGPLTWLAEVPLLALDRGGQAARLATAALGVGGLAAGGLIAPPSTGPVTGSGSSDVAQSRSTDGIDPFGGLGSSVSARPSASPLTRATPSVSPLATATRTAAAPSPTATRAAAPVTSASASPTARPTVSPAPIGPPASTYYFSAGSGGYSLVPSAPTSTGQPADTDRDGKPGATLVPTTQGLDATPARERLIATRVAEQPLRLSGIPTVVLWSRLAATRGNARVLIRLADCTSAGACTTLAEGQLEDGSWSAGSFVSHDIDLDQVDVTIAKGHTLRLTTVASDNGTKGDLWVGMGTRSAPSRLVLPLA